MALSNFNARKNMGVSQDGVGHPDVIFKRKFRWSFEVAGTGDCEFFVPAHWCKISARPNISIEETEINFLNDKTWIPGKVSWETITVTYLDVGGDVAGAGISDIYKWLTAVYDFAGRSPSRKMSSRRSCYSGCATLKLYDGCGATMETWTLRDAWPQAINFGDLDYTSSDTVDIEITLRYSMVNLVLSCGQTFEKCTCCGCD